LILVLDGPHHLLLTRTTPVNVDSTTSLQIYGPDIPETILSAAERSADNPYSCLAVCRAFEPGVVATLRHIVVNAGKEAPTVLSYRQQRSTLAVVNRLIGLDDGILERCAHELFAAHPAARRIILEGVYDGETRVRDSGGVHRRAWRAIENLILPLPPSFDLYMNRFGSKTRKNLRYCAKRFQKENPGAQLTLLSRDEIDVTLVSNIVRLNHLRMRSKGRVPGMDARFADSLFALCKSHGVACVARDSDGRILGGTLCTRVGDGLSLQVIAHDPAFNHVRLGLLCLLKSIEAGIAAGATVFHFLWGESDYRYYRSWLDRLFAVGDYRIQLLQTIKRRVSRRRAAARRAATDEHVTA
jgi:hypothetical protein